MKNLKTYVYLLIALFAVFILGWFTIFDIIQPYYNSSSAITSEQNKSPTDLVNTNVTLILNYGNGEIQSFTADQNEATTAYDILINTLDKENIPYEIKEYNFGTLITSIGGYKNSDENAWIYFVNGEAGNVAADQYTLKPNDTVEWKYIPPTAE